MPFVLHDCTELIAIVWTIVARVSKEGAFLVTLVIQVGAELPLSMKGGLNDKRGYLDDWFIGEGAIG